MGKAEQRCRQAPSVAILRHDKLSRIICRGEQRSPVLRTCRDFRIVGAGALDSPPPLTFRIIVYLTTLDNPTNIGRGEQRSPVLRTCINSES